MLSFLFAKRYQPNNKNSGSLTGYLKADGSIPMTGLLTLSGNAVNPLNPVTKQQFDSLAQGLNQKPTARAMTDIALPVNTYDNGVAGAGATLTGNANGALPTVDGVSLSIGDVVFVTNEATGANNGLYTVTSLGSGGAPYVLTRSTSMDSSAEFNGAFIVVDNEGTVNNNSTWIFNYVAGFVTGTSAVSFTRTNLNAGNVWSTTGNTLGASGKFIGSIDNNDIGFRRNNIEYMSLFSNGVLFKNAFGQAGTGAFYYTAITGRILMLPSSASTSGGPQVSVYGMTGGSTFGLPYLDNSFVVGQYNGSFVYNSLHIDGTGKILLGNTSGASPEAKLDIRTFSSSNANTAFKIRNNGGTVLYTIGEAGDITSGNLLWTYASNYLSINGLAALNSTTYLGVGGNTNGYVQTNVQNTSAGTSASSDYVATADTGNDTQNYIDVGINSSAYADAGFTSNAALDSYVLANGGNLLLNSSTANKSIKFITGGTLAANVRETIDTNGNFIYTQGVQTGLNSTFLTYTAGALSNVSAEITDVNFSLNRIINFNGTGLTIATNRAVKILGPVLDSPGPSIDTVTDSTTLYVTVPTILGFANQINAYSIWTNSNVRFDGNIKISGSFTIGSIASNSFGIVTNSTSRTSYSATGLQVHQQDALAVNNTFVTYTQNSHTNGTANFFLYTGGSHSTQVASVELVDINYNLARSIQFATGAIATQRAFVIQAPTYGFSGASTITLAATFAITGSPVTGANATLTNSYAFVVQSGNSNFQGDIQFSGATRKIGTSDSNIFALTTAGTTRVSFATTGAQTHTMTAQSTSSTMFTLTSPTHTGGVQSILNISGGAYTGLTASTEAIDINFSLNRIIQFATGNIATQRAFVIQAPTYSFVGASTITFAATFAISGPVVNGTNSSITNGPYSLWVQAGVSCFAGDIQFTSAGNRKIGTTDAFSLLLMSAGVTRLVLASSGTLAHTMTAQSSSSVMYTLTTPVHTGGVQNIMSIIGGAYTGLTASSESTDINFSLNRTVQFATGALAIQRAFLVQAPTYGFIGASTLSQAATLAITGAPVQGTNATLTETLSLWTQAGDVRFDGTRVKMKHLSSIGTAPGIAAGTGAGTAPSGITLTGTDLSGYVNFTTGTTPAASATVVTVTFNIGYSTAPRTVIIQDANANAGLLGSTSQVVVLQAGITTAKFDITSGTVGLTAATSYQFYYFVVE